MNGILVFIYPLLLTHQEYLFLYIKLVYHFCQEQPTAKRSSLQHSASFYHSKGRIYVSVMILL